MDNYRLTESEKLLFESLELLEKYKYYKSIPVPCRNCLNHPLNGGTGVCHCILGGMQITW